MATLQAVRMFPDAEFNLEWRRIQSHEQQAERKKKSIIQKAMVFGARASQLVDQETLT